MEKWSNFNLEGIFGKDIDTVDGIINDMGTHVSEYSIPKRKGGMRSIIAPMPDFKYILKGLTYRFFTAYIPNESAHGFVKNKGIVTNARMHNYQPKSVGSIDIKDFFESVTPKHAENTLFGNKRICKMCKNYDGMCIGKCSPSLYANKNNKYEHRCEEVLAVKIDGYEEKTGYQSLIRRVIDLTHYKGHAPQGFPTSPVLANLALRGFDKKMKEQLEEENIVYTRYADDLSFSSKTHDKFELRKITYGKAKSLLKAFGFIINGRKTKYTGRGGRLLVCSVVVNDKMSLARWKVRNFRAGVHNATIKNKDTTTKKDIRKLKGFASYLMSINKEKGDKYMKQLVDFEKKHLK